MFDVSPDALDRASAAFDTIGAKAVELGKLAADDLAAARGRISMLGNLGTALSGIDFVIEAVPERMDLKLSVLAEVQRQAPPAAVIASNTSALSITELPRCRRRCHGRGARPACTSSIRYTR